MVGAARCVGVGKSNPRSRNILRRECVPVDEDLPEELLPGNLVPRFVVFRDKSTIESNEVLPKSELCELPDDGLDEPIQYPPELMLAPSNIAIMLVEFLVAKQVPEVRADQLAAYCAVCRLVRVILAIIRQDLVPHLHFQRGLDT